MAVADVSDSGRYDPHRFVELSYSRMLSSGNGEQSLMNTLPVGMIFALSVAAYLTGAFASLASWRKPALARRICCSAALAGAALGGLAAVLGILQGTPVAWSVPSGIPLFAYSFSYDALAGFFNLALAIPVRRSFHLLIRLPERIRGQEEHRLLWLSCSTSCFSA